MEEHLRLHDNNPIKCPYCPWKGTNRQKLSDHMNHHFQVLPFKCSFCEVSFYRAGNRNKHEQVIHEKILDRYKCDKCPFISHAVDILNRHKRLKH